MKNRQVDSTIQPNCFKRQFHEWYGLKNEIPTVVQDELCIWCSKWTQLYVQITMICLLSAQVQYRSRSPETGLQIDHMISGLLVNYSCFGMRCFVSRLWRRQVIRTTRLVSCSTSIILFRIVFHPIRSKSLWMIDRSSVCAKSWDLVKWELI